MVRYRASTQSKTSSSPQLSSHPSLVARHPTPPPRTGGWSGGGEAARIATRRAVCAERDGAVTAEGEPPRRQQSLLGARREAVGGVCHRSPERRHGGWCVDEPRGGVGPPVRSEPQPSPVVEVAREACGAQLHLVSLHHGARHRARCGPHRSVGLHRLLGWLATLSTRVCCSSHRLGMGESGAGVPAEVPLLRVLHQRVCIEVDPARQLIHGCEPCPAPSRSLRSEACPSFHASGMDKGVDMSRWVKVGVFLR